ncbi:MAG: hypothetical protein EBU05_02445 [Chitinophagia bacterium]|nr:hypothetical protein [Chitinophagia bacterium]
MLKNLLRTIAIANLMVLGMMPSKLQAQSSANFMMSSMGSIPGASNTGMAIQFNSIATCLNVQNGVAVLNGVRDLDVSVLGSGSYVLKIESENYVDALKFIKAN